MDQTGDLLKQETGEDTAGMGMLLHLPNGHIAAVSPMGTGNIFHPQPVLFQQVDPLLGKALATQENC